MDPRDSLAINLKTESSMSSFNFTAAFFNAFSIARLEIVWKSNLWTRDFTVSGNLSGSVVAKIKIKCSGGSSKIFKSALKAELESM